MRTSATPHEGHFFGNFHGFALGWRLERTGDHVSSAANDDRVAFPDVLALDLVFVVQRGGADRDAAHEHGLEEGERSHHPGPSRVDADLAQQGGPLLGRELVRDGPAGRVAGRPQLLLKGDLIHLHHHAVDLVVDRVAAALPPLAVVEHFLQ